MTDFDVESDWFKERPPAIQDAIRFRPPGTYRLTTTDHIVHLYSYSEGDPPTCTVLITAEDNPGLESTPFPNRKVFGILLTDLVPLD